ncbi:cytoskeletal protein CcmA (bactofilin family) [Natronobacillus azotifigens]|uniref:Polymer-forming cytoskeletal protein n=1 Tax=Natronobacillus azotifigens TaxID=472978 RepID=A0A9J6RG00_9BACI|nr:polymer-forming cytoskeletal protein [Natronobacillus azotifigens]MCZ0704341.1 polymer-forming cytoskeletal protein [Natronobacillus azotifigens]
MKKSTKMEKTIDTIIGEETIIEGKIKLPTSLRVDGKVYGEIDCTGDVYIGKSGFVEPALKAKNVIIAGEVKGDVHTTEKIHIQPSGALSGSAKSNGIIVDEGGIFNGTSVVEQKQQKSTLKKKQNMPEPTKVEQ